MVIRSRLRMFAFMNGTREMQKTNEHTKDHACPIWSMVVLASCLLGCSGFWLGVSTHWASKAHKKNVGGALVDGMYVCVQNVSAPLQ